ncbi:hypothetical protein JTE90_002109 [Oedothorax gibbosus]|uniref:ubiquitinyl hydrolase 1 n=1 Tax=Oedothorax gibbosus TaxID=931172 RepID=A0AAV6V6F7_9ARAC|nr:hypothetical protein JTE90_002109 [Oedothorax gibbosus]
MKNAPGFSKLAILQSLPSITNFNNKISGFKMPATSLKKLYVAKSFTQLQDECKLNVEIKSRSLSLLVNSARKLFQAAEKSLLDKDEEKAFVQFSKFVELILFMKKKPGYDKLQEFKGLNLCINTAIINAENLKESLIKRYGILEEANSLAENEKNLAENEKNNRLNALQNNKAEVLVPNNFKSSNHIVPPEVEVIEYSISSKRLHSLLNAGNSYIIIMDTRLSKDFDESHIKHSHIINIPEDILTPGTTAAKLESILPQASLGEWYKRESADHIVILDFDSKDDKHQSSHIDVLKQAMVKWVQRCTLKKPPMVLEGGYKDFMLKYPMYTTQALNFESFAEPRRSSIITEALVSEIEYPNLDEPEKPPKKENLSEPGILFKKSNNVPVHNSSVINTNNSRAPKSAPTVDRKSKPTVDRSTKSSLGNRMNLNNSVPTNHKEDWSLPDSANFIQNIPKKSNAEKDPKLEKSLNEESSLANEGLELAKEQLAKEQEFEKLRMRKELEAEESMRIELQKKEVLMIEEIKKLELRGRETEKAYAKIKEDNAILKKQLGEKADKEFQRQKENEILEKERKKREMQENVERLREQRKQQELAEKMKELSKSNAIPRTAVSANTGLKRNMSQQDQNTPKPTEYTIPLSRQISDDSSSRGLVRSHSSPNIAQMVNEEESPMRKIPTVDRSLKPKATTPTYQQNEISRARLRNLNPVYGNVPVRPATGLRNLGNTCFMNSVIQCLSNTLPLAEYFTNRNYEEDINRDNKHGTGGEVAEEFAVVIKALWMGQYKSFSPKDFKNTVGKCLAVCIGNEQQDSHEFLVVLMEKLHADLNKKALRPIPKLESCDENKFWQHHKSYNSSKVSDMFEGLLKSTLTCMSCRTTSDSFEVFSCLSLPIMTSKCSLEDCFRHFLKSEKISGEAAWDCPKCKQKKEAEKRLRISRVPEILVIQLKRFSYEGLWRRKLQTTVNFDFHFDVPYEKNSNVYHRKYSLYGIVNHFGTLEGGHYTAYCSASSRKWYKYDDHEVSEISSSDIITPAAYLLFYRATDMHSNL